MYGFQGLTRNDFSVSGNGRSSLLDAVSFVDAHTFVRNVYPRDFAVFSLTGRRGAEGLQKIVRYDPKETAVRFPEGRPWKIGRFPEIPEGELTGRIVDETRETGFFLSLRDGTGERLMFASPSFYEGLLRTMHMKIPGGINPSRDLCVACAMDGADKVRVIWREERSEDFVIRKLFACTQPDTPFGESGMLSDMCRAFDDAAPGKTRTGDWRIRNTRSEVEILTSETMLRGLPLKTGFLFSFSDVGDGPYRLQGFVRAGGGYAYVGAPVIQQQSVQFDAGKMAGSVSLDTPEEAVKALGTMFRETDDVYGLAGRLADSAGVAKAFGANAFRETSRRSLAGNSADGCLEVDAVLLLLQLIEHAGLDTERLDRARAAAGGMFGGGERQ